MRLAEDEPVARCVWYIGKHAIPNSATAVPHID